MINYIHTYNNFYHTYNDFLHKIIYTYNTSDSNDLKIKFDPFNEMENK